jgi:hypothetical protein
MPTLCGTMAKEALEVHMVHLMVCYLCYRGQQVQSLDDESTLASPSLPRSSHPCRCPWACVALSIRNVFALRIKLSFHVVHVCCNHGYVRSVVIWSILTMIPVGSGPQQVVTVNVTYSREDRWQNSVTLGHAQAEPGACYRRT